MHDDRSLECRCCGMSIGAPVVYCDGCKVGEVDGSCDPADTWHCDGRYGHSCDGSGCQEYEGHPLTRGFWLRRGTD